MPRIRRPVVFNSRRDVSYSVDSNNALDYLEGNRNSYGKKAIRRIMGLIDRVGVAEESGRHPLDFFFILGVLGEAQLELDDLNHIRKDLGELLENKLESPEFVRHFLESLRKYSIEADAIEY